MNQFTFIIHHSLSQRFIKRSQGIGYLRWGVAVKGLPVFNTDKSPCRHCPGLLDLPETIGTDKRFGPAVIRTGRNNLGAKTANNRLTLFPVLGDIDHKSRFIKNQFPGTR